MGFESADCAEARGANHERAAVVARIRRMAATYGAFVGIEHAMRTAEALTGLADEFERGDHIDSEALPP